MPGRCCARFPGGDRASTHVEYFGSPCRSMAGFSLQWKRPVCFAGDGALGRRNMPNIPLDWTTVDWTHVGLLSVIAFLAALLSNVLIFRHRQQAHMGPDHRRP